MHLQLNNFTKKKKKKNLVAAKSDLEDVLAWRHGRISRPCPLKSLLVLPKTKNFAKKAFFCLNPRICVFRDEDLCFFF